MVKFAILIASLLGSYSANADILMPCSRDESADDSLAMSGETLMDVLSTRFPTYIGVLCENIPNSTRLKLHFIRRDTEKPISVNQPLYLDPIMGRIETADEKEIGAWYRKKPSDFHNDGFNFHVLIKVNASLNTMEVFEDKPEDRTIVDIANNDTFDEVVWSSVSSGFEKHLYLRFQKYNLFTAPQWPFDKNIRFYDMFKWGSSPIPGRGEKVHLKNVMTFVLDLRDAKLYSIRFKKKDELGLWCGHPTIRHPECSHYDNGYIFSRPLQIDERKNTIRFLDSEI